MSGAFPWVYTAPDGTLVLLGHIDSQPALTTYDLDEGAWTAPVGYVDKSLDAFHAAVGFDQSIYVPGFYPDIPELWSIDLGDGTRRRVEVPTDAADWEVDLLWTPDGRLFAFGREMAWVFTPDE